MGEMQVLIDRSLARASEFTRSLFEDAPWSAAQVAELVNKSQLTVASVSAAGMPHAAVVIAACQDERIHFTVMPGSRLERNLVANDAIAFTVCDRAHAVMGQGRAVRVGHAPDCADLIDSLAVASASGRFTPDGWQGDVYRIAITRIFAN